MWRVFAVAIVLTVAAPIHGVWADDLTGSLRFLCAAVQASAEQQENFKKAFSVCLEAKNYMVKY